LSPDQVPSVPAGPDWLHEIKYDGYRLGVERIGERVKLISKGGYNWTKRFPWIVEACWPADRMEFSLATSNRARSGLTYSAKPASSGLRD
jgi:hypothetical protein